MRRKPRRARRSCRTTPTRPPSWTSPKRARRATRSSRPSPGSSSRARCRGRSRSGRSSGAEDAPEAVRRLQLLAQLLRDAAAAPVDPAGRHILFRERFADLARLGTAPGRGPPRRGVGRALRPRREPHGLAPQREARDGSVRAGAVRRDRRPVHSREGGVDSPRAPPVRPGWRGSSSRTARTTSRTTTCSVFLSSPRCSTERWSLGEVLPGGVDRGRALATRADSVSTT